MTTANHNSSADPSYSKLITRALRLLNRNTAREQALADAIADAEAKRDDLLRNTAVPADAVPIEITETLRSDPGIDRVVVVMHDGMRITALLHPIGRPNPEREAAVWRCLRDTAISVRDERRQR